MGIRKAPKIPCPIRLATSMPIVTEIPHRNEQIPNPTMLNRKVRTDPKRPATHPVKGTQIASATA